MFHVEHTPHLARPTRAVNLFLAKNSHKKILDFLNFLAPARQ